MRESIKTFSAIEVDRFMSELNEELCSDTLLKFIFKPMDNIDYILMVELKLKDDNMLDSYILNISREFESKLSNFAAKRNLILDTNNDNQIFWFRHKNDD